MSGDRKGIEGEMPPTFYGFAPSAAKILKDLAENQTVEWFMANRRDYEGLVRRPMRDLVQVLDRRFRAASIPLCGHPEDAVLPVSLDRRPGDRRPRYRRHPTAIMTTSGSRRAPGSLVIEFGVHTSRVAIGFHDLDVAHARALHRSMQMSPQRWAAVEHILRKSEFDVGAGLAAKVEALPARTGLTGGVFVDAVLPSTRFARPDIVGWIVDQATAATPFLQIGCECLREPVGRRKVIGVTSSG